MGTPISQQELFRGDLVVVAVEMFSTELSDAERRRFVHTTMRRGDTDVELCDNPYRPDPTKLDYSPVSRVKLIRRGNWFNLQHRMELQFGDDPTDELLFWKHYLGAVEVRNPAADGHQTSWTRQQALNGLSAGIVDLFVVIPDSADASGEYRFTGFKLKSDEVPGGILRLRELNREVLRAMAL